MAGRPAASRGGGLTGLHYGLIAFVILFVLALAGFIWVFTLLKGYQDEAVKANRRADQFGSPASYYVEEASSRRAKVAAVMDEDLSGYGNLVAGDAKAVYPAVLKAANVQLGEVAQAHSGLVNANDTLLTAQSKLSRALSEQKSTSAALGEELEATQEDVKNAKEGLKKAQDEFEAQVAALQERVAQLEQEKNDALAAKDAQLGDIQSAMENATQEGNQAKQDWVNERRAKDLEIGRLQTHVSELQKKLQELKGATLDPTAILTKADGRVLRAIPGSDIVYINLGANDKIKPGMGFEVFAQLHRPQEGLRGKASLEVATVMEDTAECRVVRTTPGQPVVEGDICVNVAFERGRLPKFVIRGEFDLNYDGVIDFDGIERVTSIITEWGGQVVPELDETVDYVVIGISPQAPKTAADAQVSTVVSALAEDQRLARTQWSTMIEQARSMYIPVITQNQFLFLMGYAGDESALPR